MPVREAAVAVTPTVTVSTTAVATAVVATAVTAVAATVPWVAQQQLDVSVVAHSV